MNVLQMSARRRLAWAGATCAVIWAVTLAAVLA